MEDRITPYDEGGDIKDRIDEVVATGVDVHLEMLDDRIAWMRVGDDTFQIFVQKRQLVIRHHERLS